jgi:hypothetical protein
VNEDSTYKISANLTKDELAFLDTVHKNHSEALRILIKNARVSHNGVFRQILFDISIGCIALALFFIWASVVSWVFLLLAFLIFGYELYDIIRLLKAKRKNKSEAVTV